MRYFKLLFFIFLFIFLEANDSRLCKTCHPKIYSEYQDSMHFKSTIKKDKIHNIMWQKHPLKQKNDYKCAMCHDPKVKGKLDSGVDCISCHKIKDIKEHTKANINIYEETPKTFYSKDINNRDKKITYHKSSSFFGLFSKVVGSPYHDIDYTNKNYYNGRMCMGCHSHLQNSLGFTICQTPKSGASNIKQNCITCHMPKVSGSATTIKQTKTHVYHGFLGAYNKPNLLSKYINLNITKSSNGFSIVIKNLTPHPFFTQPLRAVILNVEVKDKDKIVYKKQIEFIKIIGKDSKATLPAFANSIIKDTMIKANESRVVNFDYKLKDNQKVVATLGFYIINPKSADKLGVKDKKLTDFIELKKVTF